MFWKILRNYKDIVKLIKLVRDSYTDKNLSKVELKVITFEILELLEKLGLVKE